ncbi:glycosyltransferase family 4 protein [Vibrio campbellii]|uniref:glycosyltransferase family 4 protein n=1 Tax=Vibrio campbellii TaxID=680 RepID=UPI001D17C82A|nr:glycosyltransferase family 4 protein [Vibrio campbellii]MCC4226124.1 glycosyltransferase family 4 protein [Vibrio campbellii]
MNKKILHVQLLPLLSGVQRVSLDELRHFPGYERHLVVKEEGPLTIAARNEGIHIHCINDLTRTIKPLSDFFALIKLYRLIKSKNFDIVHTHSSKTGILGRVAARLAGTRFIAHTVHGFAFDSTNSKFAKLLYKYMETIGAYCSDVLICLHDEDKKIALTELKVPEEKIKVIPNAIDVDKFKPAENNSSRHLNKFLSIPNDSFLVGMTGRLWEQKNPILLLESIADIIKGDGKLHLVYFGDGPYLSKLKILAEQYGIEENIHLPGWVDDVSLYLNNLDVFVLPSLWEGMPLAILEASSCGVPSIVSDIPGNKSLIANGVNGLVFESGSKSSLHKSLNKMIYDNHLRASMSEASRSMVEEKHDLRSRNAILKAMYEQ